VQQVIDRTRKAHPYEVPCILAIPVETGNPDYLQWVLNETTEPDLIIRPFDSS
jgi:periplasmic divalent cation tolerance protein